MLHRSMSILCSSINSHIYWDTLNSMYPYLFGQPVIDAHIYWDPLFIISIFVSDTLSHNYSLIYFDTL